MIILNLEKVKRFLLPLRLRWWRGGERIMLLMMMTCFIFITIIYRNFDWILFSSSSSPSLLQSQQNTQTILFTLRFYMHQKPTWSFADTVLVAFGLVRIVDIYFVFYVPASDMGIKLFFYLSLF